MSELLLWTLIACAMVAAGGAGFVLAWLAFEWRQRGFYLIERPRRAVDRRAILRCIHLEPKAPGRPEDAA